MSSRSIRGPLRFDTYAVITTGNYTIVNESMVIANKTSGAATTVTLPPSAAAGVGSLRQILILDGKGDAASNNITITAAGSDTINGAATLVLSVNYAYSILNDLGGGNWVAATSSLSGSGTFTNVSLSGLLTESGADSLTALGTNQATALALTKEVNRITVGASTTGATLPLASKGLSIMVINSVANSVHIYGAGTDTINDVVTTTGVVQPANSICIYVCSTTAPAGKWYCESIGGGYSGSLATLYSVTGLTAAGGGQGGALLLPAMINDVTTVGAGNGVLLQPNAVGMTISVTNDGANALTVYPDTGAAINGLPTNTGTLLPIGATAVFTCVATNVWKTLVLLPREVNTALTTAGAGIPLAAGIVGGVITRTGPVAAFSDTTDTAVAIIAALHGATAGQSWEFTYVNTTAFTATFIGGVGVTVSELAGGTLTCAPNSWARFLVTVATGTTVTMACLAQGPNNSLPPAKFTTMSAGTGTLALGAASGAAFTSLTSTGATPGSQAMRTVAQVLVDTPGLAVGTSYILRVTNSGAGSFTLATDGSAQFTMTGNMIVPVDTFTDFVVTINTATTGTVQEIGSGVAVPQIPPAKFSTINVTTGTLAAGNASGAAFTALTSTNATPGAQAMRTPAQILTDTTGLLVGQSYVLRVTNTGAGIFTLATDSGGGFTMTGNMAVPVNTFSDFVVTLNTATTGTVQVIGTGIAISPVPAVKLSTGTTTGTFTAAEMTGAAYTVYTSTAATPGSIATATATAMFAAMPGAFVGQQWIWRVINSVTTNSMTITADGSVTITGKTTLIATPFAFMDWLMTFTGTTTASMQYIGGGVATTG